MADTAGAHRHGARVADLEERVIEEVTRDLHRQLAAIADDLRAQAPTWRKDPAAALRGRRALAARLRKVRPGTAAAIRGRLAEAVQAGAGGADVDVNPRDDELVARVLREADARVRAKARQVAHRLTTDPLRTDVQVRDLVARVLAVESPASASASVAVVRAADVAAAAVIDGRRVWVTRPDCCVHCAAFAGAVAPSRGLFLPLWRVADHPLPWVAAGVPGPPLHDHCRCVAVKETRGLGQALAKESARQVAEGKVGYASGPAKARAAGRLLASRAPLAPAVRRKAARLARSS